MSSRSSLKVSWRGHVTGFAHDQTVPGNSPTRCIHSVIPQAVIVVCSFYIPVLCTAPNKYTVVDATGAVKPQCCVDMWVSSLHPLLALLSTSWLFGLQVLRRLSFPQSHQTQGRASVPLWGVRQVPAAGVGAEPAESSWSQRGDGHTPSISIAGSNRPPRSR